MEQPVQQQAGEKLEEAQQQQAEQQAEQPPAPRQGSAGENEQPAERNSQEQPRGRRRSSRAAKRTAPTEAQDAAAELDGAGAPPPGKRGRAAHRPRQRQQPHRAARAQHPVAEPSDNEADGREEAAAAGTEPAVQLPLRPLLQEPPVPLEGADCGLPPGATGAVCGAGNVLGWHVVVP